MSTEEYQPRTPERLIEILQAGDPNPRSWQQEAAKTIERLTNALKRVDGINDNPARFSVEINDVVTEALRSSK